MISDVVGLLDKPVTKSAVGPNVGAGNEDFSVGLKVVTIAGNVVLEFCKCTAVGVRVGTLIPFVGARPVHRAQQRVQRGVVSNTHTHTHTLFAWIHWYSHKCCTCTPWYRLFDV